MEKEPSGPDLDKYFARILDTYGRARRHETFSSEHPVWGHFAQAARILKETTDTRRDLRVRWSVGQGRWATVPWIAIMDAQETTKITSGVYAVYLFRADMTGLYLSLNQGSSDAILVHKKAAPDVLARRARVLESRITTSAPAGFAALPRMDIRAHTPLALAYEAGSIVHKLYERGSMPPATILRDDLVALLDAYRRVVPSGSLVPTV
jgi:hypothetical protein